MTETKTPAVPAALGGNPWQGKTVHDALAHAVSRWPDHEALVDGDTVLTFRELSAARDRLAVALSKRGIANATHVAVHLRRSWEHVVLLHALWQLGAVVITLNTAWESEELAYALTSTEAQFLVTSTHVAGKPVDHRMAALGLPAYGPADSSPFPLLQAVISDDPDASPHEWSLQSWLRSEAGRAPDPVRNQDAVILFTSGSTARPKGVVIRQEGLLGSAHYFMERLGLGPDDRFLGLGQYFHAGGLVQLLGTCLYGTSMHIFDGFQPEAMAQAVHERGLTATTGFDLVLGRLWDDLERKGWHRPSKVGCAPGLTMYDRLEAEGATVVMMYAMSEAANMVTLTEPRLGSEKGRMSNGRPLPGVTVRICDPASGAPLPAGTPGEICFTGWNLFSRYYGAPDLTRESFDDEGFFHTGDYGWLDENGRLYYRGRYSSMIKTGGENVSETEVESFLVREISDVVAAAVVGIPDTRWGEAVVAFVELRPGAAFDPAALRRACRGRIAGYKIPKRFLPIAPTEWPTTPMGKLLRKELRQTAIEQTGGEIAAHLGS
ncbi:class I adenylate-forming enzyme family protein [Parafrankia sp. EUN1f]|uniref:class I adenylate-forming enzyme family protein n=1 Tax=Parafrankia sp. EUN1f TaxID=102897 RepID=UPI0001C4779A|nr:class I adenylate-forming enzyme family protein [Parafrankia sp. EUN1f]EFC86821.1 AMP-dependent synthetase and ligase [Parafrankia sp. EUN1f]